MNKKQEKLKVRTIVTQPDLNDGVWDAEHKGLYSKDGKRFLRYERPKNLKGGDPDTFQLKSGVEVICEKAFSKYYSPLTAFVIPESVVAIGDEAFQQMKLPQYGSITITKGLKYIGHHIFGNTHGILNVIFEEGITDIDIANVLSFPAALTVYLPSTLKSIGDGGFGGYEVSHIYLAEGSKHFCIEDGVLYDYAKTILLRCPVTKRGVLKIPESVNTIAPHALQLCGWPDAIGAEPELKLSVILPNSLLTIKKAAFRASWLESIYIPSSVSIIEDSSFDWPVNLKIEVASDNSHYEVRNHLLIDKKEKKVLYGYGDVIDIPNDIKMIADNALGHFQSKSIVIPEGVSHIGRWNFNLNKLSQIRLSSSLQHITRESFWGSNFAELPTIIVPSGMGDVFKEKLYGDDYDIRSYIKEIEKNLIISEDGRTVLGVYDTSITSIEIPFGIEIIGERAFDGCWLLREVVLPESVKQIERWAFSRCKYLRKINLPMQLTEIEQGSFDKCEFLESIDIPKTVKCIGSFAFSGCKSLRRITLPQGLTSIGDRAFSDCDSLRKIIIPGSIKSLGNWAFWYCKGLKDIVLNEGLEEMDGAFPGCISVKSINLPNSLKGIEGYSLNDFEKLKEIRLSEDNPHFRFIDGVLYSRDLRKIIRVMSYHEGTFIVPKSVRVIGCLAFDGCKRISKVVIPDTVKTIERMGFHDCTSLKEVILPQNLKKIDSHCFAGCIQLSHISIPDSVREIDWCGFRGCDAMKTIHLPDSLKAIGANIFPFSLKTITVSPTCRNFTTIDGILYNKDVTELVAFPKNSETTHFVVPDSVKKLGSEAFWYCEKLKSIKLPDGLAEIGNGSFSYCRSLMSISLPDGIKTIPDAAFDSCKSLRNVKLPSHLQKLGEKAFFLCSSLSSITLPKSLMRIKEFSIPDTIREIHVPFRDPQKVAQRFYSLRYYGWNTESEVKLFVPKGTKTKYLENGFWADWLTIEEEKD